MNKQIDADDREPAPSISPAQQEVVELESDLLYAISGGDIGSGLIVIPK